MKEESRAKRALNNTIFGLINRLINIASPFITRTLLIYVLGMEYAGLNSLFTSVLQMLNLAELGISTAVVYCMYKPMAMHDTALVCALLKFMKKVYYYIGTGIMVVGLCLLPILHLFIKGETPSDVNIYILYLIFLFNTTIGYFFYAYKSTLLNAGQKVGVISNVNSIAIALQSIIQILLLLVYHNYYAFLAIMPIFTLLYNIWVSKAVNRIYPNYRPYGTLDKCVTKDIYRRIKGLFITKICTTTRTALNNIFISSLIGLTTVAIYGNYYYIMAAVISVLGVVTTAMTASVGNSLVTESTKKNYDDMRKFNFIFNWIVGYFSCCLLLMFQPFMRIWVGSNNTFPYSIVIALVIYFYSLNMGSIRAVYHDAAGLWWEARYRAILEAVANLVLNYVLTLWLGVIGTILGTLISLVIINYGYGTLIVFQYYFKGISPRGYFADNILFLCISAVCCVICYAVNSVLPQNGIMSLLCPFAITSVLFNVIYYLFVCKLDICHTSLKFIKQIVLKK